MRFKYLLLFIFVLFSSTTWAKTKVKVGCIDCYSSASLIPALLEKLRAEFGFDVEVEWVLVQTHEFKPYHLTSFTAFPDDSPRLNFKESFDEDPIAAAQKVADRLREMGVEIVVGGADEGTYQAVLINKLMGFTRDNDADSRDIRNQKYAMGKAVLEYGIPAEFLTEDIDAAMRFIDGFPQDSVVVKWNSGAGGVDMQFLSKADRPALIEALKKRLANRGKPFHGREDGILLEPQIDFEREIYANTFTWNGETVITGLWEYYKVQIGEHKLYFVDRPLSLFGPEAAALRPIAQKINERMKQRTGMAHLEMGQERGTGRWLMIENNTRVVGSGIPALEREIWGLSHLDLFLMSLFQPQKMESLMASFRNGRPKLKDGAVFIMPISDPGIITADGISVLEQLPTYLPTGKQYKMKPGTEVKRTSNLNTGVVMRLVGDTSSVERDFKRAFTFLSTGRIVDAEQSCSDSIAAAQRFYSSFQIRSQQVPWEWQVGL